MPTGQNYTKVKHAKYTDHIQQLLMSCITTSVTLSGHAECWCPTNTFDKHFCITQN